MKHTVTTSHLSHTVDMEVTIPTGQKVLGGLNVVVRP